MVRVFFLIKFSGVGYRSKVTKFLHNLYEIFKSHIMIIFYDIALQVKVGYIPEVT